MTNTPSPFQDIINTIACCSVESACVCGAEERVLRAYTEGRYTIPMSPEQREWCLDAAEHAGEGAYPRDEASNFSDSELANWVLDAWNDYVRSNC